MSTHKVSAPVVGFNHNIKHQDQVFHVQTEDSGLPHAHYITHLFAGGNIINSMKTSYADQADAPDLAITVRKLMEAQHKQMLKRLVAGEFNALIGNLSSMHYAPGVLASGEQVQSTVNVAATAPMSATDFRGPPTGPPLAPPSARPVISPPPHASLAPLPAFTPPQRLVAKAPPVLLPRPSAPPFARPSSPPRTATSPQQPVWSPAPPGPSAAPRQPGAALPTITRSSAFAGRPKGLPPRLAPTAAPLPTIFADDANPVEAPHDDLPILFAEELISEKSLDEVILAFLSSDLEPPK